jgi:hypothetical protein
VDGTGNVAQANAIQLPGTNVDAAGGLNLIPTCKLIW